MNKEPLCDTCQDRDKKDHESNCSGCYDYRMNYVKDPYIIIEELQTIIEGLKADIKKLLEQES
jgi:transcription initiation factor IIE alpha subunit